jgi:hypothetical protein
MRGVLRLEGWGIGGSLVQVGIELVACLGTNNIVMIWVKFFN